MEEDGGRMEEGWRKGRGRGKEGWGVMEKR